MGSGCGLRKWHSAGCVDESGRFTLAAGEKAKNDGGFDGVNRGFSRKFGKGLCTGLATALVDQNLSAGSRRVETCKNGGKKRRCRKEEEAYILRQLSRRLLSF